MLIRLKNKDTLILDEFKFKCCIGQNGKKKQKKEGDRSTPKGNFGLLKIYYRKDRVKKPISNIKIKSIKPNMVWCDDPKSKFYNKEMKINKRFHFEKLYRKDHKYDYFIVLDYNKKKTIPFKGSAIFIHLTKNYKKTAGCIALKKSDFVILLKLINKNTKININ